MREGGRSLYEWTAMSDRFRRAVRSRVRAQTTTERSDIGELAIGHAVTRSRNDDEFRNRGPRATKDGRRRIRSGASASAEPRVPMRILNGRPPPCSTRSVSGALEGRRRTNWRSAAGALRSKNVSTADGPHWCLRDLRSPHGWHVRQPVSRAVTAQRRSASRSASARPGSVLFRRPFRTPFECGVPIAQPQLRDHGSHEALRRAALREFHKRLRRPRRARRRTRRGVLSRSFAASSLISSMPIRVTSAAAAGVR